MLPEILWNVTELKEGKRIYEKAFIGYHNKYRNHDWNYLTDFDSGNWKDEYPWHTGKVLCFFYPIMDYYYCFLKKKRKVVPLF